MTTDIYGTLGPACADVETLKKMFEAGMTGIRLNLSHVTLRKAAAQVEALHKAAEKCGVKAKLLIDMQGPELRLPSFETEPELIEGETVVLGEGGYIVGKSHTLCVGNGGKFGKGKINPQNKGNKKGYQKGK